LETRATPQCLRDVFTVRCYAALSSTLNKLTTSVLHAHLHWFGDSRNKYILTAESAKKHQYLGM